MPQQQAVLLLHMAPSWHLLASPLVDFQGREINLAGIMCMDDFVLIRLAYSIPSSRASSIFISNPLFNMRTQPRSLVCRDVHLVWGRRRRI
ncbi:hypothetical protein ASPWEDRAFT_712219 [Aspergillus wentii DTO 134E9]|uniref:Uncharacterized protein n=1 Tax=Aspergillus wentii DTO 134E9 TaxID=1073089 RepID=A0A1L9R6B4_ASPWE|nr:uncharacterized protein ASPWEDRAFT_712219 [Aspergillus wentii DTO 134E9]OJJ30428.1 hypothetical protein ASPWEDRAFT_712219 [Aspergillus wentii DTO 134E9]